MSEASSSESQSRTPISRMTEEDWMDVMESEFVDFTESAMGTKLGFVFEHDDLGIHGFQFHKDSGTIEPCAFNVQGDGDE